MKYEITHLKAPWPKDAKVGDVFEVGDGPIPAWALGKVKHAGDDAKTTLTLPKRKAAEGEQGDGAVKPNTPVAKEQAEAENADQRALREREEQNLVVSNGGPATAPPSDAAVKAAEGKAGDAKPKK